MLWDIPNNPGMGDNRMRCNITASVLEQVSAVIHNESQ